MAKKNQRNNSTELERLFEKILRDRRARQEIVTKHFDYFFPIYFYRYLKYETAPFQEEIFGILEDESIKLAIIIAFRGSAKSTIVTTAYVLWSILGVQQKKFIVIHGRTEREARQYLLNIKYELEHNDLLKKDLGPFDEERNSLGNATALVIRKLNAKIMISSTEQSIRGMRHGEHRPDLIILDDVEDTNTVKTQEGRDKIFNWLTSEVIPAGDGNTRLIAVGNLLHGDSLLKRLERKIESGEMSGVYREYPIIDAEEKPLWPGKYPAEEHIEEERRKAGSNTAWAREYLLKIISTDDQLIRREWIKTYKELPPRTFHSYYAVSVDLALSLSSKADFTAIVSALVCGRGENLRVYILPNPVNERLTSLETIERVKAIARTLGYGTKIWIEDVQYQGSIIEHLRRANYKAAGAKVHGQDKYSRLSSVSFLVQDGKVLFPEKLDKTVEALVNQAVGFGIEKHDDLVDAFSMLLMQVLERDHRPRALALSTTVDDSDLRHLNPRAQQVEMEKRRARAESLRQFLAI